MSLVLALDSWGEVSVSGEPAPFTPPAPPVPANEGSGDVRKKIVPIVRAPAGPSATEWEGGTYLSLQEWLDSPQQGGAILLQPADDARLLEGKLDNVGLISVDFHRIGDGRGYTHAFFLRERLGYKGQLRAINAVTVDQVYALARVGFDSFALRAGQDPELAQRALKTFSVPYQSTKDKLGALQRREDAIFDAKVKLLERSLREIAVSHEHPGLASSLSAEDMVITDAIARLGLPIEVFTLETGRLHAETLALHKEAEERYNIPIRLYRPDADAVAGYVAEHGLNGFYEGVEQRKQCCNIRKVVPLARALEGRGAWVTGQRREQAATRTVLPEAERDTARNMEKYNPLADWSWADVLAYAARYDVPMSALYKRGYVSIGCEPCTRAIRPGEDPRAGRWWWESQDNRECGLHAQNMNKEAQPA